MSGTSHVDKAHLGDPYDLGTQVTIERAAGSFEGESGSGVFMQRSITVG